MADKKTNKKDKKEQGKSKELTGEVVSIIDEKSIGVETKSGYNHPLYRKLIWKKNKLLVHVNAKTDIDIGDKVLIREFRPVSKRKRWVFIEKLDK